ncbi:MAG TPA: LacI family DNA-binding transcriptional regulator [Chthonomonas sp.]|uniref:LacI family DNA-binding transcriptional regulator n=1 Tax=Chthonomonas sp. TaxID=2282153 RepID=UPI002B4B8BEF|nr:LacI family DNA-binding transcriptional regulator [Chthonomonas sp.]HLH80539.1 LacI family DNA-binding transcriptional regulator [Chthonomonas sp.]
MKEENKGRKMVTLEDVAKRAGVSRMTVSAVLNRNMTHVRVSNATQQRVLQAATELDYFPNAIARSLRKKRTGIVGFYGGLGYLNASLPFYSEIIGGLQRGCDQHRLDLLVHGTFPRRSVKDIYAELVDGRLDGLIVHTSADDPLATLLAKSHLPVVALADAIESLPSVVVDDFTGGKLQAEHLAYKEHSHVLYRASNRPLVSVCRRYDGFMERAQSYRMRVTTWQGPENIAHNDKAVDTFCELLLSSQATAVVCWNDMSALDTLVICRDRGLNVPNDIAVVGYDGIRTMGSLFHRLTTVKAPWFDVASQAIALLVEQIARRDKEQQKEVVLPVEFVYGDTA